MRSRASCWSPGSWRCAIETFRRQDATDVASRSYCQLSHSVNTEFPSSSSPGTDWTAMPAQVSLVRHSKTRLAPL